MTDIKGIISATAIALDEYGAVNENGSRQIIRHNIDKMGCSGLFVAGSTAECSSLSIIDKEEILRFTADEVKGQVPLIAHVGATNIDESIYLGKLAKELGYTAISSVPPFYFKVSYQLYCDWYHRVCDETEMDMLIYNIPHLTGASFTLAQFEELYKHEKIIGVKFTNSDFYMMEQLKRKFPSKLLFAGFDEMLLPALSIGVDGGIGSTYNFNGERANRLYQAYQSSNNQLARELQGECNELIEMVLGYGLFPCLKYALSLQGVESGYCKAPFPSALTDDAKLKFKEESAHLLSNA
ncbi:N-acetylneuraminate lyase [Vibrio sinensis]|uniref:N-acetylneuraminate lyase n=1 Tax=Vibrio sinensis TaxID=2302434 RepID=A0A3A6QQN5_9VIBR|nr:N-acetylneuraminate lyase [Vibrio sinensis]RJX72926.1 N-acetylneuraminate lyase [Vibrio sinensis]